MHGEKDQSHDQTLVQSQALGQTLGRTLGHDPQIMKIDLETVPQD